MIVVRRRESQVLRQTCRTNFVFPHGKRMLFVYFETVLLGALPQHLPNFFSIWLMRFILFTWQRGLFELQWYWQPSETDIYIRVSSQTFQNISSQNLLETPAKRRCAIHSFTKEKIDKENVFESLNSSVPFGFSNASIRKTYSSPRW